MCGGFSWQSELAEPEKIQAIQGAKGEQCVNPQ